MAKLIDRVTKNESRRLALGVAKVACLALAGLSMACASSNAQAQLMRPSEPLVMGEPAWPADVVKDAERADRVCSTKETQLLFDYKDAQDEQQKFKTIMGSITGGIGTVGGAVGGVGGFVIDDPDTLKKLAGITGVVTAGLGAAVSVVGLIIKPGKDKEKNATQSLQTIEQKRVAARKVLKDKDPGSWSDAEKEAWSKAQKDLEAACK